MDKKRGSIVLLLSTIIICILSASAFAQYSTSVFSGQTFSGTSIDVDDYSVIVTMNYQESRIFVDGGDDWASINKFSCGKLKNILVCFSNVTFDDEELRTFIELNISKNEPAITISRTIDDTEFYAGEEQTLKIVVENSKDIATDCTYYEDWGEEFEVIELDGPCSRERTGIIWKGDLDTDDTLECEVKLKAKKPLEKGVVGSLEFFNGLKVETEYSTELMVAVEPIVEIVSRVLGKEEEPEESKFDWEAENSDATIGEEIQLALNVSNMLSEAEWVDVNLEIQYPASMTYTGAGFINYKTVKSGPGDTVITTKYNLLRTQVLAKSYDNTLKWNGRLNNRKNGSEKLIQASEIFIPKFITKKSGSNNIHLKATFEDKLGRKYTHSEYIKVNVVNRGVKATLYINDLAKRFEREQHLEHEESIDIDSLNEYKLKMQIENSNHFAELRNIEVEVSTNLTNFSKVEYPVLELQEYRKGFTHTVSGMEIPYKFMFNAPRTEVDKDYDLFVTITGLTEFGEKFTNTTEFTARVNKFEDIQINHEFESTNIEGDEDTLVTTLLKNNRVSDIKNVHVTDYVDPRLGFDGVNTRKLTLKADEEVAVYSYMLTAPRINVESGDFFVNTTVKYYDPDYDQEFIQSEESKLTIKPKELRLTVDRTIDNDEVSIGDVLDVKYVITNSEEEETITNIQLYLPMQKDLDIVGSLEYTIPKLRPGESITLPDKHKIKLKHNGSTTVEETRVVYRDIHDTIMFEDTGTDSITIDDESTYAGPAIFVTRELPLDIYANDTVKIKLRVQNKGDESAEVTINESRELMKVTVPARGERTVDYSKIISSVGDYLFEPAIVTYEHQGEKLTTITDTSTAKVEMKVVKFVQVEEIEEEPEEVIVTEITTDIDKIEDIEKSRQLSAKFMIQALSVLAVLGLIVAYLVYKLKGGAAPPVLEE